MSTKKFDLASGALALDLANTVNWHASDQPQDGLADYFDLLAWGTAAGTLDPDQADHLGQLAEQQPAAAAAAFGRAIKLREALYRLFSALATDIEPPAVDLAILNEALGEALAHQRLASGPEGFSWSWAADAESFDRVAWPVARSAADLLVSDQLDRVRECADDRGCGYLFIDLSRNRSRRWCSMESCGNRAKAKRHYQRAVTGAP